MSLGQPQAMEGRKTVSRGYRQAAIAFIMSSSVLCAATRGAASAVDANTPKIDYVAKLDALVKKGSDESLNAESLYRRAFELYVAPPAEVDANGLRQWPTDLSATQQAGVRKWIDANADSLLQLRLGTQRSCYWTRYQGSDIWTISRHATGQQVLLEARLAQLLAFRAKLEAQEGRIPDALQDLTACLRLGSDLKKRLLLTEQLAGTMICEQALKTGFQILHRADIDRASLEFLDQKLAETSKDQDLVMDLSAHELSTLSAIKAVCAKWPGGDGRTETRALDEAISSIVSDYLMTHLGVELSAEQIYSSVCTRTPEDMADLIHKTYADCQTFASKTPFQQHEEDTWHKAVEESTEGNALLDALISDIPGYIDISFRCRARRDALIATLGLLKHQKDRGSLPGNMQELLSAGYISRLPMDPYSDKTLVYRRTENTFMLYSVGADFQDNGGKHSSKWTQEAHGGDLVFWPIEDE